MWRTRTDFSSLLQRDLSSSETKQHAEAQQVGSRAYSALKRAVKVYAVSEDLAERDACKQISKLFKVLESEMQKNSTTQSSNQSRLLLKLRNSENAPLVNLLQLEPFVDRLQSALTSYDNLVQAANSERALAKKDKMNVPRSQVMAFYNLVLSYVQAMVVIDKYPFVQVFFAIDEARIKFSTDIQSRITRAENLKVEAQKKLKESKNDETNSRSVA